MKIYLKNNNETYAISDMVRLYLPEEKLEFLYEKEDGENIINVIVENKNGSFEYITEIFYNGKSDKYVL